MLDFVPIAHSGQGQGSVPTISEEMEQTLALSRKFLESLGIEEKQTEAIIEAHSDTVNGLKKEAAHYKEEAEKVPDLLRQLEEAKADTSLSELQQQYDSLKEQLDSSQKELERTKSEYDEYKSGVEARETEQAKALAYRKHVLEKAGIATDYMDDVMAVTKLDSFELDEDGGIKDADKLVEAAKDKWKSFVVKERIDPAGVDNPPVDKDGHEFAGAHERAIQIAKERHERLYGKSEE